MVAMFPSAIAHWRFLRGGGLAVVLALATTVFAPLALAQTGKSAENAPAKSSEAPGPFAAQLEAAQQQLAERGPKLEDAIRAAAEKLKNIESQLRSTQTPELLASYEDTLKRKDALQKELIQLQDLVTVYRDATDTDRRGAADRKELEEFRAVLNRRPPDFSPSDVAVWEAKVQQQTGVIQQLQDQDADRVRRLAEIDAELNKPGTLQRTALEQEREVLLARQGTLAVRQAASEARLALFQAKLEAARRSSESQTSSRPATGSAPSTEVAALAAENKKKLADELALDARGRQANARRQKSEIQRQISEARRKGEDTTWLETSLQYWTETEDFETRAIRLSTLRKQEADLDQQLAEMETRIQRATAAAEQTRVTMSDLTPQQRHRLALQQRVNAESIVAESGRIEADARRRFGWLKPTRETLLVIAACQKALEDRLKDDIPLEDYNRLYTHYQRMKRIFDSERQQIDQTITVQTVMYYQNLRLATLKRELASAYMQAAEILEPTQPSFFEKNKRVFRAMAIFLLIIGASYATKLMVWLAEFLARRFKAMWPKSGFSIKRVTTLASFAASITRLFIWIFGVITILFEFGIDPATSTGAIGLVGLIMAGMFQQIVVDFIKGLDIVAGRHYNVGDFVELDGKYGHVIDFSVKYTRIRTFSGQELNIPNSRCIPSRRFPDGYVDNYVDIVLSDGADVSEAKNAINRASMYVTRQLEPVKERPAFVDRFRTVGGRPVLRYHVRVLPGCEWVVTDYFIPVVKSALQAASIGMEGEPKYFYINRIDTFRKLFSRQLTEQEILQEAAESDLPTASRGAGAEHEIAQEKAPLPVRPAEAAPGARSSDDGRS